VLIGADAAALRWAALSGTAGQLGPERSATVDSPRAGLWYGVAGAQAPADTVLAAVGLKAANGVDQEIHVVPLPADGSAGPASSPVLATVPGGAVAGARPLVAMASSRLGMTAALAWVDPASRSLMLAVLGGSGDPVVSPRAVDTAPAFGCVGFQPGKAELTLAYYKYADATSVPESPTFGLAEIHENGSIDSTLTLMLPSKDAACPLLTPTADGGYALAWQDSIGTWLSVYDPGTNIVSMEPVAGAVTFGGADLQPPLAGFGPVGTDYVIVFAKLRAAELWRLDGNTGAPRRGTLGFPSLQGNLGAISSLPVAGSLHATYADYSAVDADVGTDGQRYLISVSCL
jgi:hypothetical protein